MSAIDDRLLELVHADLDRPLTPAERAELGRGLLGNPEARRLHDDLHRLKAQIRALEPAEPPSRLRRDILDSLHLADRGKSRPRWGIGAPAVLRYAAVFCGGAILAAVALQSDVVEFGGADPAALIGTMVRPSEPTQVPGADRVRLDSPQLSGQVSLYRVSPGLLLEIELASSEAVEIVAAHGGREVRLTGLGGPGVRDSDRYAVLLPDFAGANATVELKFFVSGALRSEHTLLAPPAR